MDEYKNLFQLNGKVALVTGAAGILGVEFCKTLYSHGAKVACLDSDNEPLAYIDYENNHQYLYQTEKGIHRYR